MSTRIDIRSQARWLTPIATLLVASSCVDTDSTFPLQPSSRVSHAIGYCPPGAACYPLADFMSNTVYMDIQNVNGEASEDCRLVKDALLDAYWGGRMAYFDELVVPNEWGSYSASQFQITLSTRNWTDPMAHIERRKTLLHEGWHWVSHRYLNEPYDWGESSGQATAIENQCAY